MSTAIVCKEHVDLPIVRCIVDHECRLWIPAAASTFNTSASKASLPSSKKWMYSLALKRMPLLPLLPRPLLPLPFGRPLVGMPVPGGAPAGASSVVSCR